jgi:hypothetical protein
VSAAVIDRHPWRWKVRVRKRPHGDTDSLTVTVFGVEDGRATNRAEPEGEAGALIADTNVFGRGAEDLEGSGETGQRREYTPGPALAGQAVADTNSSRLALDLDTKLSAGAGSSS